MNKEIKDKIERLEGIKDYFSEWFKNLKKKVERKKANEK